MESSSPQPPARLYFVRHGRSTHNESDEKRPLIWDAPLHKIGIRQAALLCPQLQQIPFDICFSSPLSRALQTALISLGVWKSLSPGCLGWMTDGQRQIGKILPTVQMDNAKVRFDASEDEIDALEIGLGPGARVRLRRCVELESCSLKAGETGIVTNSIVQLTSDESSSCLDIFPMDSRSRCPIIAFPEASEQLHESDDIGSSANELRKRFPSVDFRRLPMDNKAWWWSDPLLHESQDASCCRRCWEVADYDEPDDVFQKRITEFIKVLQNASTQYSHIAIFAHCWVLEEIWLQCFGQKRRFANAELALVEVSAAGKWLWLRKATDSTDSDTE